MWKARTEMTARGLNEESTEGLKINFSFTPSGGSLVNSAPPDL